MHDEKAAFASRLRQAMIAKGWRDRPSVLERKFNTRYEGRPMSLHGVRRWLLGETMPPQDKLVVLAEILGMDPQILRFGRATPAKTAEPPPRWDADLGWSERELFRAFMRLPPAQRRVLREVILTFVRAAEAVRAAGER